ncbi:MAG: SEC-C metal-binding domain-containing protein [Thermoguttaceae bacterium]
MKSLFATMRRLLGARTAGEPRESMEGRKGPGYRWMPRFIANARIDRQRLFRADEGSGTADAMGDRGGQGGDSDAQGGSRALGMTVPNGKDRRGVVSHYKRMRALGRKLNQKLVEGISDDVIPEGGKRLGILQRGALVFNTEDECSVLMDYCLYDVRRKGRNAVEQYLVDRAPAPDTDKMACLRAMQQSRYTLLGVESVLPGLGVAAGDLFSNETLLIVDMGLSKTAKPGLVLASRLLFFEDFAMLSGAALPIGILSEKKRDTIVKQLAGKVDVDADGGFDPAPIIRWCLRKGASSHIEYQGPKESPVGQLRATESVGSSKAGRNASCPCGSGKKFKHCCVTELK